MSNEANGDGSGVIVECGSVQSPGNASMSTRSTSKGVSLPSRYFTPGTSFLICTWYLCLKIENWKLMLFFILFYLERG